MTTELQRDHTGRLHLFSNGAPVRGAIVTGIDWAADQQVVRVAIPLKDIALGEIKTVVPFVRPEARAA